MRTSFEALKGYGARRGLLSGQFRHLSSSERKRLRSIAHTSGLTDGSSGHANTIRSYPTRAACFANLRDHAVRVSREHPTSDLAADYSLALTSWADACACSAPTLAGVTRASNDAPATKVEANVSLQSPLSPGGGNALEYARCCGRQH